MSRLGRLLILTDRRQADRPLVDTVRAVVDAGARTVVLREKDLPTEERQRLADEVAAVLDEAGGTLVLAGASLTVAAGVPRLLHLSAAEPASLPAGGLARSCHDEEEVRFAVGEGCAYVTVSPVFTTQSKPGYGPTLGVDELRRLVGCAGAMPVYALAGITVESAADCVRAGAAGVAVMGAVMRSRQPDRLVARYLARLQEVAA